MIKLDPAFVTVVQDTMGAKQSTTTTDTLFISQVRLDFTTGAIYATIQRGALDANGQFISNYPDLDVIVNPDGSFIATNNLWSGSVANAPTLVQQLKSQFDQMILASGVVGGTLE